MGPKDFLWPERGKAMTNYEAMQTMDKDELVEFLSSIVDCEAMRIMDKYELANFLSRFRDCKKCPASEKFCDGHVIVLMPFWNGWLMNLMTIP